MKRTITMFALAMALTGCAVGAVGDVPPPDDGTPGGEEMGTSAPDMNTSPPDMGGEEMGVDPSPRLVEPTIITSSGGGVIQTPRHRARVIIGAPSPAGTARTPRHTIQLGAGAAQHGQGSSK